MSSWIPIEAHDWTTFGGCDLSVALARTSPDGCGCALDPGLAGSGLLAGRVRGATGGYRRYGSEGKRTRAAMRAGLGDNSSAKLLRQLLRRVDRFLYIGEANRQFYLEQGIDEERLAPAPYCVDNDRFAAAAAAARPERHRIREEWGIPAEAFCFLFAGKFVAKKRPFDLIEAARRLQRELPGKKIHLVVGRDGRAWRGAQTSLYRVLRCRKGKIHQCPERTRWTERLVRRLPKPIRNQSSLCRGRLSRSSQRCQGDLGSRRQRGNGERAAVHCEQRLRLRGGSR